MGAERRADSTTDQVPVTTLDSTTVERKEVRRVDTTAAVASKPAPLFAKNPFAIHPSLALDRTVATHAIHHLTASAATAATHQHRAAILRRTARDTTAARSRFLQSRFLPSLTLLLRTHRNNRSAILHRTVRDTTAADHRAIHHRTVTESTAATHRYRYLNRSV